jgi:predicted CopG family antitoxin
MPREGYRSITVKEDVYCQLEKIADATHRTVPEVIEHLIEQKTEVREG